MGLRLTGGDGCCIVVLMTNYLDGLDPEQKKAVTAPFEPLAVMAGAGSGKTRIIVSRIAYQVENGVNPSEMFVAAFTRQAAKEMSERVQPLVNSDDLVISTFHSLMFRFMNRWMEARGQQLPGLAKEYKRKQVVQDFLGPASRKTPDALNLNADVGKVLGWIGRWKNSGIHHYDPEIQETVDSAPRDSDIYAAAKVYPMYEKALGTENLIDFDDMLLKGYDLLKSSPEALALAKGTWKAFLVDECQDSNSLQWGLLEMLAPPSESPNLTVVGDLRQSLYEFRGASPEAFENFMGRYKGALRVDLVNNYRSVKPVVDVANKLISGLGMKDQVSVRGQGGSIEVHSFIDSLDQAHYIASDVLSMRESGLRGGDVAVLTRTNAQSADLETAFVAAGLPYWCKGGGFFDRMEVGDIMAYLRLANGAGDERWDYLSKIINRPTRFLGGAFVDAVRGNAQKYNDDVIQAIRFTDSYPGKKLFPKQRQAAVDLSDLLISLREAGGTPISPRSAISMVLNSTGYIDWLRKTNGIEDDADSSRIENIETLLEVAGRFSSIKDLIDFTDECSRLQIESKDATQICTIHASKGSEWPVVWLWNMHDDSLPHIMAKKEGSYLSERRAAYVAFTRAQDTLKIGVPSVNDKGVKVDPSRFIADSGLKMPELAPGVLTAVS